MNERFKSLFVQLQLQCSNCNNEQSCFSASSQRRRTSSSGSIHVGRNIKVVTKLALPPTIQHVSPAKATTTGIEEPGKYIAAGGFAWKAVDSSVPLDVSSNEDDIAPSIRQGIDVPLSSAVESSYRFPRDYSESPETTVTLEVFGAIRGQTSSPCSSANSSPMSPLNIIGRNYGPFHLQPNQPQWERSEFFHRTTERHVVGRGVLLDWRWHALCRGIEYSPFETYSITLEELKAIAAYSNIRFMPGDVLLLRTGWTAVFITLSDPQKDAIRKREVRECCGVESSSAAAEWHQAMRFKAVVTDASKYEAWPPPLPPEMPLSEVRRAQTNGGGGCSARLTCSQALTDQNVPIGECWDLERLSDVCARQGQWSFFFSAKVWETESGGLCLGSAMAMF